MKPVKFRLGSALLLMALLSVLLAGCKKSSVASNTSGTPTNHDNETAATVNGKTITWGTVDRLSKTINLAAAQGQRLPVSAKSRDAMLDTAIEHELLFQRAERLGKLPSDDEVTGYLTERTRQSGLTDEQYQKRLSDLHLSNDDLRDEARRSLAIERIQSSVGSKVTVTEREVAAYYTAHSDTFVSPKGVGLSVIAKAQTAPAPDTSGDQGKAKIDEIYGRLKNGSDFSMIARAESDDKKSAPQGGDIGFFTQEDLKKHSFPAPLVQKLLAMNPGEFTEPVFNGGLWCVFKVNLNHSTSDKITLETKGVREQIVNILERQKLGGSARSVLDEEKATAKIVKFPPPAS